MTNEPYSHPSAPFVVFRRVPHRKHGDASSLLDDSSLPNTTLNNTTLNNTTLDNTTLNNTTLDASTVLNQLHQLHQRTANGPTADTANMRSANEPTANEAPLLTPGETKPKENETEMGGSPGGVRGGLRGGLRGWGRGWGRVCVCIYQGPGSIYRTSALDGSLLPPISHQISRRGGG